MEVTDGSSWIVASAGHDSANIRGNSMSGTPAMTPMTSADIEHGGWYSAAGASSFIGHSVSAGASDDWVQTAYEIRADAS